MIQIIDHINLIVCEFLFRMQCDLSCALVTMNRLINLIEVLPKGCDTLCAALMSTVTDYSQQVMANP